MKLQLTETQYKRLKNKLLKEEVSFSEKIINSVNEINKALNKLYSLITFSTIAEIRDGDVDVHIIEQKHEALEDNIGTLGRKIAEYFDRYSEEEYEGKNLEDVHLELESKIIDLNRKSRALGHVINQIKPLTKGNNGGEEDWDEPFKDIKPMNIE